MFDLERQESRWIERREFLTTGPSELSNSGIAAAELRQLYSRIPDDAPFVRLRSLVNNPGLPGRSFATRFLTVRLSRTAAADPGRGIRIAPKISIQVGDDDYDSYDRYSNLDDSYERTINDRYDARVSERVEPGRNPHAAELEHQFLDRLAERSESGARFRSCGCNHATR